MKKSNMYQVHNNQTWLDISLKLYGSVEFAFELATANNSNIAEEIPAGTFIFFDAEKVSNKTVLLIYSNNKTNPATGFTTEDKQAIEKSEGISIWAINLDFKISE